MNLCNACKTAPRDPRPWGGRKRKLCRECADVRRVAYQNRRPLRMREVITLLRATVARLLSVVPEQEKEARENAAWVLGNTERKAATAERGDGGGR